MIFQYLVSLSTSFGPLWPFLFGAVCVSVVFTIGGIIHSLWSFIRGS